jgi:hypothetical protein
MKIYQKMNLLLGWVVFAIASTVYILTSEPTASFWDCGEYIATAFKLQVGHPPGAPLFQLMGRFFTLFVGDEVSQVARMVNIMSALASGFTILFLFWTITHLTRRMVRLSDDSEPAKLWAVLAAGLVGSLAYTFSDSFWFSAVEGEVYATSSFFTAIVFWAILRWEEVAEKPESNRWLILIAYLMGLSIGVHMLNLLAIPAIVFVVYFKKYKPSWKGAILSAILSVVLLAVFLYLLIPGIVSLAGHFERLFVNDLKLPFNSGTLFYFALIIGLIVFGLYYSRKKGRVILNTAVLSILFILIGYSSFFLLVIRSNANPPIDENNPEDAVSLLAYLNREQYGEWPIFSGFYYNAPFVGYEDGNPVYGKAYEVYALEESGRYSSKEQAKRSSRGRRSDLTVREEGGKYVAYRENLVSSFQKKRELTQFLAQNTDKEFSIKQRYVITDDRKQREPVYDQRFKTIFPRMWSQQRAVHASAYEEWAKSENKNPIRVTLPNGKTETRYRPSFSENIRYFFRYQLGHMYFRYFMWNFSGRQNDIQGHGDPIHGNWITGIGFLDQARLGPQNDIPYWLENNKGRNRFYLLPFILGVFGLVFHFGRDYKGATIVSWLFIMTGLAIVFYLNQYPYQPRERDYAYAASFYAFAIWIGIGVYGLFETLRKYMNAKMAVAGATAVSMVVPGLMAAEGWDDHDRSDRYTALSVAKNYLDSCEPNAILFTNGDNDTFPLWYAQEVEGYRTDVRVVNLSLLNTDWYIDQMSRKAYLSDPVPFSFNRNQYLQGRRDYVYLLDNPNIVDPNSFSNLKDLMQFVGSDNPNAKLQGNIDYIPTKKFRLPVNRQQAIEYGIVPASMDSLIVENVDWTHDVNGVQKNHLMVLNFLAANDWKRPVYFAITTGDDSYVGLTQYFQLEGMAYRLIPVIAQNTDNQTGRINTDILYKRLMEQYDWTGYNNPDLYLDETNRRMVMNFRNVFGRLANALLDEGKTEKAIAVSRRCLEVMPHEIVEFDYFITPVIESMNRAGLTAEADSVMDIVLDRYETELDYYFRFDDDMLLGEKIQTMLFQQQAIRVANTIADSYYAQGKTEKANALIDRLHENLNFIANTSIVKLSMIQNNGRLTSVRQQSLALMNMISETLKKHGQEEKSKVFTDDLNSFYQIMSGQPQ